LHFCNILPICYIFVRKFMVPAMWPIIRQMVKSKSNGQIETRQDWMPRDEIAPSFCFLPELRPRSVWYWLPDIIGIEILYKKRPTPLENGIPWHTICYAPHFLISSNFSKHITIGVNILALDYLGKYFPIIRIFGLVRIKYVQGFFIFLGYYFLFRRKYFLSCRYFFRESIFRVSFP